jgi:hypothetical protein
MKAAIEASSIPSPYLNLGNNKKNSSKSFSFYSGVMDVPHTTNLAQTGKSGAKGSF